MLVEEGGADYSLRNDRGETALEMKRREIAEEAAEDGEDDSDDEMENLVKLVQYLEALVNGDNTQGGDGMLEA